MTRLKAFFVVFIAAVFGSVLCILGVDNEITLSKAGIGPVVLVPTISVTGKTATLNVSAKNNSTLPIGYAKFCVRGTGRTKGCDFEIWTTAVWRAGQQIEWKGISGPARPGLEKLTVVVDELRRDPNLSDAKPLYRKGIEDRRAGRLAESFNALSEAALISPTERAITDELDRVQIEYARQVLADARKKNGNDAIAETKRALDIWPQFDSARLHLTALVEEDKRIAMLVSEGNEALKTKNLARATSIFQANTSLDDSRFELFSRELAVATALDSAEREITRSNGLVALRFLSGPNSGELKKYFSASHPRLHSFLEEKWPTFIDSMRLKARATNDLRELGALWQQVHTITDGGNSALSGQLMDRTKALGDEIWNKSLDTAAESIGVPLTEPSGRFVVVEMLNRSTNFPSAVSRQKDLLPFSLQLVGCEERGPALRTEISKSLRRFASEGRGGYNIKLDLKCDQQTVTEASVRAETSTYISGYNSLENPDYLQLLAAISSVQADYNRAVTQNTINPNFFSGLLVGLLSGRLDNLRRQLASTSPVRQSPILLPYTFYKYESIARFSLKADLQITLSDALYGGQIASSAETRAEGIRGALETDQRGIKNERPSLDERGATARLVSDFSAELIRRIQPALIQLHAQRLHDLLKSGQNTEALALSLWSDLVVRDEAVTSAVFPSLNLGNPGRIPEPDRARFLAKYPFLNAPTVAANSKQPESSGSVEAVLDSVVSVETETGSGSGFFVSSDGLIVTNHHVIEGARLIAVKASSGDQFLAKVEAVDIDRDLALLRVGIRNAKVLRLTATAARLAEPVLAVGNPSGLDGSVTKGIVSGYRTLDGVRYVQTDAAINPGNSGGPLIDSAGAVLGVTSLKISSREGLAFAIDSSELRSAFPTVFR